MNVLSDQPSKGDQLKFRRFLDAFEKLLFNAKPETPLTIGIYGDWGTGKTSLLQQLKNMLETYHAEHFKPIQFTPWAYQHEPNLLVPLLVTLMTQTRQRLHSQVKKIAAITAWHLTRKIVLPVINVATGGLSDPEEIKKSAQDIEEELDRDAPKMTLSDHVKLRELVHKFIRSIRQKIGIGDNQPTLVFLIDDLDRCHPPDRIVAMLEEIKVFLDIEGCIFLIACDRQVVIDAIEGKFPGQGQAYLEKFIQLPFPIPRSHPQALKEMLAELVGSVSDDLEWLAYWEHIAAVLDFNPRRLKRMFNEWLLGWEILQTQSHARGVDRFLLAKWLLLRHQAQKIEARPELYLELEAGMRAGGVVLSEQQLADRYDLSLKTLPFLNYDVRRFFGSLETLSLHSRLSAKEMVVTRYNIEEIVARGESLPLDLKTIDLSYAHLPGANFAGCDMENVNLRSSNIENAIFDGANIASVDFSNAYFTTLSLKAVKGTANIIPSKEATKLLEILSTSVS